MRRSDQADDSDEQFLALLTGRERDVLGCLAEGHRRRDVAEHLHLSPNTVRTHLQNIMAKLGVHSALEAVALIRTARSVRAEQPSPPETRQGPGPS